MRSGDVTAMEEGWIFRRLPGLIPATGGPVAGRRGWRPRCPPMPAPRGRRLPAAAAGEEVIADRREPGPEDQPRSQHQQVGGGHPASLTYLPCLSGSRAAHRDAQRVEPV